jgi:hypothetical protein
MQGSITSDLGLSVTQRTCTAECDVLLGVHWESRAQCTK